MYLKCHSRHKDGKTHHYWNVMERVGGADVRRFERQVLCLGELGVEEKRDWEARIERVSGGGRRPGRLLFELPEEPPDERLAEDRAPSRPEAVRIRLSEFSLRNPRQYGGCWLFCTLWGKLGLDAFWLPLLPASRKGTPRVDVLKILCANRLLDPSSEWRVHREWFKRSAMGDLLGCGEELSAKDTLYRYLDLLLEHKDSFFQHLRGRWTDMFNASCDVLLCDLTSTYFESDPPFPPGDKRMHGYSRDHRGDCVQIVIALVVTPDGLPVAYEVIHHSRESRIESHVFVAFIAYSLSAIQMIDVHFPIGDARDLVFSRYTTPEADQKLILDALGWELPPQNPPKITTGGKVETGRLATDF